MTTSLELCPPPLIPRETLFGNPEGDSARVSPDGARLAYLAPHDGKQSVWVRTIGARDDRVVAHDPVRPLPWATWQGDGRHILYLQDRAGDENYHLYQVDLEGGAPRDLTPGEHLRALPLALDARFPQEALVTLNARTPRLLDVHRVNLAAGLAELDTENSGDVIAWLVDNALVVRAAVAQVAGGSYVIRVRDGASAPWRVLDEVAFADGAPRLVAFSSDDRALFAISAKDANANRLVRYDLATAERVVVLEDPEYDVERVFVDPATHDVVAAAVCKERLVWAALTASFAEELDALRVVDDGDFSIEDASADGATLIVRYRHDARPEEFYAYDRARHRASFLFCSRPPLLAYELAPMRPVAFPARDGLPLRGYLTLPVGAAPRRLPMVLYVHGGPWYRDRWGYEPIVQWLANRGYAVLQVNFRGSTGYGKAFLNAGNREWAGAMRTDLLDARDWAVAEGYADPARIAIFGGSYGGYAVLTALAWTPDAFACGVDIVGPSDLRTFLAAIPAYWEPMRQLLTERVGDDPEFLKSQSPLFRAPSIRVPLLVVHGANDPRVKQQESDQLVEALRGSGVPVQYLVFDNEGHGLAHPANLKRFAALAEAFLAAALGGRIEPPQPDEAFASFLC
ncbi:peptidase S9 prolyl oligopeptidase (plasmid) [Gemmatirosa kalamazoonensis]|uniref:Peptidase S9 prolyl oligopeptidase n=1 Tax=Gemmatirosa kalamazoonensis TaxID=861299 RepID=W0RQP9_9BACT|nr:S9 family peptidase [Gemmatirosa kalamazoonensis]AHG93304.1 peptidase S9 prolyl oligopeptidase [Gemmatirosa kalamazoonensis]